MKDTHYILLLISSAILLIGCSKNDNSSESNPSTTLSETLYVFGGYEKFPGNYVFSVNSTTGDLTPFDTPGTFTEESAILLPILIPKTHIVFGYITPEEKDGSVRFGYYNLDTKQCGILLIGNTNHYIDNEGSSEGCIGILNDKPYVILSHSSKNNESDKQRLDLYEIDIITAKSKLVASIDNISGCEWLVGHFGYDKATNTIVFSSKAMYFWDLNTNTVYSTDANIGEDNINLFFPFRGGTAFPLINTEAEGNEDRSNIFIVDFKNKKWGDMIATVNTSGENLTFAYDDTGDKLYFICEENSYYVDVYDFNSGVQSTLIPDDEERAMYGLILMK